MKPTPAATPAPGAADPFPATRAGEVIGLLGGSFDPAHEGHAHITRIALERFALDRVWWLVSPGNPLKEHGPAPLSARMEAARAVTRDPRVLVTDIEAYLGTPYTAETLTRLVAHYPQVRFTWLMGADNLQQIHLWQDWRVIFDLVPVGVMARPGAEDAGESLAAQKMEAARLPESAAATLARSTPPAWCLISIPLSDASSSKIRARGLWGADGPRNA